MDAPGLRLLALRMTPHAYQYYNQRCRQEHTSMFRILILLLIVAAALVVIVPRLMSGSAAPSVGSEAPNFTLPSQDGSSVSLKDYRGKWVVLYFYPKDQTPG